MALYRHVTRFLAGLVILTASATPALAVDGCKVLLCFAGNWRDISECRPEVEQALKDQARGKGWPTCSTTQSDGSVTTDNSIVPRTIYGPSCPYWFRQWEFVPDPTYNSLETGKALDGKIYGSWQMTCQTNEILAMTIGGQPWKASYVMADGSSIDRWLPAALAAMPEMAAATNTEDAVQAAWVAAGSPTTKPPLPGPLYVDLASGAYRSCYPYSFDVNTCNWYDDAWYVPW
jgi:hypothetical protein